MTDRPNVHNAKITSWSISNDDHGILSMWISLEWAGSGQGYGGYALDEKPRDHERNRFGGRLLAEALLSLFRTFEIGNLDQLKGQPVRVQHEKNDSWGPIIALGHFTKDQWFSWQDVADRCRAYEASHV